MTNEQAVELCRRARSVCLMAIRDCRSALSHWCDGDPFMARSLDQLERDVCSYLDDRAKLTYKQNANQMEAIQSPEVGRLIHTLHCIVAASEDLSSGPAAERMADLAKAALVTISGDNCCNIKSDTYLKFVNDGTNNWTTKQDAVE